MKTFQLKGIKRDFIGKRAAKTYRKESLIPCVLYGGNESVIHFNVFKENLRKLIYTPDVFIINLNIEERFYLSILKEIQFHPASDEILHVDFLRIFENKPVTIEIPVALEGLSKGVKAGGKLSHRIRKLKVKGLYKDFPEKLVINVENLELGKTIQVKELFFDNLELLNSKDNVVVSVKLTRAASNSSSNTVSQ